MNKAAHSGFETRKRRHQKSKTGVSMGPSKGWPLQKILKSEHENNENFKEWKGQNYENYHLTP